MSEDRTAEKTSRELRDEAFDSDVALTESRAECDAIAKQAEAETALKEEQIRSLIKNRDAAIAAKIEAEKWKQEMADQGQELAEKLGEAEARILELEDELQDAKRYLKNADQIILKEADHLEEWARTLRILAGDDGDPPEEN